MKIIWPLVALLLVGCAAAPEKLESVGRAESARLARPAKRFSSYAAYELRPMVLSEAVKRDEDKVAAARELEAVMHAKLQPLLNQWQAASGSERSGTLIIEPQLASLRIVSSGARFWIGGFAGDSNIDMDLVFTEKSSGQQIAKARITRSADAMTGGWSVGKSDQNLLDYIASIAYYYMTDNY